MAALDIAQVSVYEEVVQGALSVGHIVRSFSGEGNLCIVTRQDTDDQVGLDGPADHAGLVPRLSSFGSFNRMMSVVHRHQTARQHQEPVALREWSPFRARKPSSAGSWLLAACLPGRWSPGRLQSGKALRQSPIGHGVHFIRPVRSWIALWA